jgi:hypothetical protein
MQGVRLLVPFEEVVGPFTSLKERNGALFVKVGKYMVVLPLEMKETLSPLLGRKCGIIRTDIPEKEYLIRVLSDPNSDSLDNDRIRYQDEMQNSEEVI